MGSEGRREQTFKTDQDNALIYADPAEEDRARASEYFEALAVFAQEALERCGYPACPGRMDGEQSALAVAAIGMAGRCSRDWIERSGISRGGRRAHLVRYASGGGRLQFVRDSSRSRIAEQLKTASFFKSILALHLDRTQAAAGILPHALCSSAAASTRKSWTSKSTAPGRSWRRRACSPSMPACRRPTRSTGCRRCEPPDTGREGAHRTAGGVRVPDAAAAGEPVAAGARRQAAEQLRQPAQADRTCRKSLLREAFQTVARVQSVIDDRFRTAVWAQLRKVRCRTGSSSDVKPKRSDARFPKDASLHDVRYAVVDTELTSLDARSNRLLSIGAIAMDGTKIRFGEQFYRVVNPGVACSGGGRAGAQAAAQRCGAGHPAGAGAGGIARSSSKAKCWSDTSCTST